MAVFNQPIAQNFNAWELEEEGKQPAGSFVATILECKDEFDVVVPKKDETGKPIPGVTEKINRTSFLMGFRDGQGKAWRICTRWMKISGHEKSGLYKFLKGICGKIFPYGQDYNMPEDKGGVVGKKILLTILHEPRRDGNGVYVSINSAVPVPDMFNQNAPVPPPVVAENAPAGNIPF